MDLIEIFNLNHTQKGLYKIVQAPSLKLNQPQLNRARSSKLPGSKMKTPEKTRSTLKISCILTSYNRPQKIRQAIMSVKNQTYPHWELIIVDDNSNVQTQNILKEIAEKDPRITLIQSGVAQQDRGKTTRYATCINLALPKITGDLVTYLTDDDIYYPIRFEKMAEVFHNNPHIHVVYGKQKVIVYNNNRITRSFIRPLPGITRFPMGKVDHNSFMHRKSCLDLVENWDDHPSLWKAGDAAFFRKLVKHWDFHPLNVLTDEHRIHEKGVQKKLQRGAKPWNSQDAE